MSQFVHLLMFGARALINNEQQQNKNKRWGSDRNTKWLPGFTCLPAQLTGHEEGSGARGTVVVHVRDGDAWQAEAVVDGPLTTSRVPWREQRQTGRRRVVYAFNQRVYFLILKLGALQIKRGSRTNTKCVDYLFLDDYVYFRSHPCGGITCLWIMRVMWKIKCKYCS